MNNASFRSDRSLRTPCLTRTCCTEGYIYGHSICHRRILIRAFTICADVQGSGYREYCPLLCHHTCPVESSHRLSLQLKQPSIM